MLILIAVKSDTVVHFIEWCGNPGHDPSCQPGQLDEGPTMKPLITLAFAACALCASPAQAHSDPSTDLSAASGLVVAGSALVVGGSLSAVAATGSVVIASVQVVAGSVIIVLEGASHAAQATIRLSGQAVAGASLVAGTAISVVTLASGYVLITAGEAIAFIPTEVGKALLHHSRHDGPGY
jgi:hypothetical protein